MKPEITIRPESPEDRSSVYRVNSTTFPTSGEARLVETLREVARPLISLVAESEGAVVGHILFTPIELPGSNRPSKVRPVKAPPAIAMGLGPMAVAPEHQSQGVGSALVKAGLDACREIGARVVFVVGHPEYYPRFGFEPAADRDLHYKGPTFDPYLFVLELEPKVLDRVSGFIQFHPEFDEI